MRIVDLIKMDCILIGAAPNSKSEAIDMLVDLQAKSGNIADVTEYKNGILKREEMGSTAVGEGIAIPHAKSDAVKAPSLAAMTVPDGQHPRKHAFKLRSRLRGQLPESLFFDGRPHQRRRQKHVSGQIL